MTHAKFVKHVRIGERDISHRDVGVENAFEHILDNGAGAGDLIAAQRGEASILDRL